MKHVAGVHGKGINILSSYDDYLRWLSNENNLQHHFVLQKCIYHSHLLDDKKYILRVYFLTIGSKCYLYHDCLYYTALFPLNNDFKDTFRGYHDTYVMGEDDKGRAFIVHVSNKKASNLSDPHYNTTVGKRFKSLD